MSPDLAPIVAAEYAAARDRAEDAEDARVWLGVVHEMIRAGQGPVVSPEARPENVADRILEQYRRRWPREDGRGPFDGL